jgi:hypothetical protein
MKRTRLLLVSGGAVVVLGMTGAALGVALNDAATPPRSTTLVADDTSSPPESPFESPSDSPSESPSQLLPSASEAPPAGGQASGRLTADQATRIALRWVGGGRITDIEAEFEHGRPVWKVELVRDGVEHDVYVDRETGSVIKAKRDGVDDRHGNDDRKGDDRKGDNRRGHDDRHGDDRHGDDDNSGSGSGDNSGRDHPEDD